MKKVAFFLALLIGVFFISENVNASIIFSEDFNDLDLGNISGQNGWTALVPFGSPDVANFGFSQSMKIDRNEGAYKNGSGASVSSTTFDFYFADDAGQDIELWVEVIPAGTGIEMHFDGDCNGGVDINIYGGGGFYQTVSCFWWYNLEIEWNANTSLWKFRLKNEDWSPEYPVYTGSMSGLQFWNTGYPLIYIDNISVDDTNYYDDSSDCYDYYHQQNMYACLYEGPNQNPTGKCSWDAVNTPHCIPAYLELLAGDSIELLPYSPPDCFYTKINTASSTFSYVFSGELVNPTTTETGEYNHYVITDLIITFTTANGSTVSETVFSDDIYPGSALAYSDLITLDAGSYRIDYDSNAYDNRSNATATFHHIWCNNTGIGTEWPTANMGFWASTGYLDCNNFVSNCIGTSTSWTDKILCESQGFFVGLICPDPATLSRAKAIITDINNRFPISYINVIKNSLSVFSSNTATSTATTSATTTYFDINFNQWSGISAIPLLVILRNIFSFFIIIPTTLYIIKFATKNALK